MNAAQRFFAAAIREYGIPEGDHVRIPMRQCELARRRQVSASTVGAYLTAIGATVVSRRPDIVLRVSTPARSPAGAGMPDASPSPPPSDSVSELLAAVAVLVSQQASLLEKVAQAVVSVEQARGSATELRAEWATSRGSLAADAKEKEEEDFLPAPRRREPREVATSSRGSARIELLLAPLHGLVRERGLVPMNNLASIQQALAPYDDTAVRQLVDEIVREARHDTGQVRSPFGLLVARARRTRTEREHDEPAPAPTQRGDPSGSEEVSREEIDDGVFDLLVEIERTHDGARLLRTLDRSIIGTFSPASRRLLSPTALRALRAEALRRDRTSLAIVQASMKSSARRDASERPRGIHPA